MRIQIIVLKVVTIRPYHLVWPYFDLAGELIPFERELQELRFPFLTANASRNNVSRWKA